MEKEFLSSCLRLFNYYKSLGDKTFLQLSEQDLLFTPNSYSNNIAIIVRHLSGNMKSRWTNFLTEDGEKNWREREKEFSDPFKTKIEILKDWEAGWDCLFKTLNSLKPEDWIEISNSKYPKVKLGLILGVSKEAIINNFGLYFINLIKAEFLGTRTAYLSSTGPSSWHEIDRIEKELEYFKKEVVNPMINKVNKVKNKK